VIGRWLGVDPEKQFSSPYVGMGNNPIGLTDPTGGKAFDWFKDPYSGEVIWLNASGSFTDNGGGYWESLSSSLDFIVATHNRDAIGNEPMNSALFEVYKASVSAFEPVGAISGNTVPAGKANVQENSVQFEYGPFNTIAEGIYTARQQFRGKKGPSDLALIINEGRYDVPTTPGSPRPFAGEIFLHWGNPHRKSLISYKGEGFQFSQGCLTTGCGGGARERHVQFFNQYLKGFHGAIWLRGR
jgi:hypothetical protein